MKTEAEIRKLKNAVEMQAKRHSLNPGCNCPGCLVKATTLTILDWVLGDAGPEGERFAETVIADAAAGR